MGAVSAGVTEQFRLHERRRPAVRRMGAVAAYRREMRDFTLIRFDEDLATYVYGPEVSAELAAVHRPLPRSGADRSSDYAGLRLEFTFSRQHLKAHELDVGATLVWAEFPGGMYSVFLAPLQRAGGQNDRSEFPLYDEALEDHAPAARNPLNFERGDADARAAQSDLEAIRAIRRADRDIYLTETGVLRGSFGSEMVEDCYPAVRGEPERWTGFRKAPAKDGAPESHYGVVQDFPAARAAVTGKLCQLQLDGAEPGEDSAVETWEKRIREGFLRVPNGEQVPIPPELEDYLFPALDISVLQSLSGPERFDVPYVGTPVHEVARRLFNRRMEVINKWLLRSDPGRSAVDISTISNDAAEREAKAIDTAFAAIREQLSAWEAGTAGRAGKLTPGRRAKVQDAWECCIRQLRELYKLHPTDEVKGRIDEWEAELARFSRLY